MKYSWRRENDIQRKALALDPDSAQDQGWRVSVSHYVFDGVQISHDSAYLDA